MIREYENSPSIYLSFTDCRRKLAGERVMVVEEKGWGGGRRNRSCSSSSSSSSSSSNCCCCATTHGGKRTNPSHTNQLFLSLFPPPFSIPLSLPLIFLPSGDAGTILRVHQFLDHWGLINGQISEDQRPPSAQRKFIGVPTAPWRANLKGEEEEVEEW